MEMSSVKRKRKYFEKAHIKSINHKNKCEELKSKKKLKYIKLELNL